MIYHPAAKFYLPIPTDTQMVLPDTIDLAKTSLRLKLVNDESCVTSLVTGDLRAVKRNCDYVMTNEVLPPDAYRISKDMLLLSNVTEITWSCTTPNGISNQSVLINQTETIVKLRCDCDVYIADFFFPKLY
jgi:hypothetical protein